MGKTTIEWCDFTLNPWRGCTNCYAEREAKRFPANRGIWGPNGTRVKAADATWKEPLKWNREAEAAGERRRVFCASLADVFEDWKGIILDHNGRELWRRECGSTVAGCDACPIEDCDCESGMPLKLDDLRRDLFAIIDATPWLDWLLLTKRPENVLRMWPGLGSLRCAVASQLEHPSLAVRQNVWIGTSVSNQETADKMIPELLKCRDLAPVLFLSIEPLLGPLNIRGHVLGSAAGNVAECVCGHGHDGCECSGFQRVPGAGIHWVIVGGESGHDARPLHPDWVRSLRDQCTAAGVPFFMKQWGEWHTGDGIENRSHFPNGFICPAGCFSQKVSQDALESHSRSCTASRLGAAITPMSIYRVGKKAAGRLLDGREWSEFPQREAHA